MDKDKTHRDFASLQAIRKAARNGADLIRRILTFTRKVETSHRLVDLNQEVRQAETLLRRTIPETIHIETRLADNLRAIYGDPSQIEHVILNLAVNAKDAMPDGGKLIFETRNVTLDEDRRRALVGAQSAECCLLSISDTGRGMEREVLGHIFEPFYTTKKPGEGTGLGLAMVFGIVRSHGGHIACASEPGAGTTFSLYFPAATGHIEQDLAMTMEIPVGGTETILFADDDELIRELGKDMLTLAGYKVITASDGLQSLEIYEAQGSKISLVILDLIMPGMGGQECLEKLVRINPHVKVLLASGYPDHGPIERLLEAGTSGFVNKPYDAKQLLRTVRRVLDEQ
jgi:CheY-like chemotaxis protein